MAGGSRLGKSGLALAAGLLACWLGLMPLAANGQTVTYTLSINDNGTSTYTPGDFAVYASDSTADGNFGICAFSAQLAGYDSIVNTTPYVMYIVSPGGALGGDGFCTLRTPTNGASLTGSEDFSDTFPASSRVGGFGQMAAILGVPAIPFGVANEISSSPVTAYSVPLLLGTGTFGSDLPRWSSSSNDFAELFVFPLFNTDTLEVGSGLILDTQTLTSVPEPASLKVFGLATMVLLSRRPRGG
jgi:hypothetical protein